MDEQTLSSLAAAYNSAPSSELAKILIFAHIDKGDIKSALPYLNQDDLNLTGDGLDRLIENLVDNDLIDSLSRHCERLGVEELRRAIYW